MSGGCLHVVAGVLVDGQGRVLIAQRPAGRHLAGGWEFPGGKLQAGESRQDALRRELREEIGIEVLRCRPLIRLRHHYPDRAILLDVWRVEEFSGEPAGLDGQHLRWCPIGELPQAHLLPADVPVITALRLPTRITAPDGGDFLLLPIADLQRRSAGPRLAGALCGSLDEARAAADAGAQFIVCGCTLAPAALAGLCDQVNLPVFAAGMDLGGAWEAGAVGIAELAGAPGPTSAG